MTTRRKRLAIVLAIAALSIATIVGVIRTFFPPWLRTTLEHVASEALGRDVSIAGPFELSWSLTPKLTAGGITLANAAWGSERSMIRVERAALSVELASLWSRPVRVRELEIENAHVLLETNGAGRGNWVFETGPAPAGPSERPARSPFVFDRVAIRGFEVEYRRGPDAQPVVLGVTQLSGRLDPTDGMIDLDAAGQFNDAPWEIAGRIGTLDRLYAGRDLDHTLAGRVGPSRFTLRGHIGDPLQLGDPDLELDVHGPDLEAALATFGLGSPLTGPFQLKGRLAPAEHGVHYDLSAALGETTATARGEIGALLAPGAFEAAVTAAGPDASVVGSWTNVQGLPARPFDVAGRVRLDKRKLSFDGVTLRVGGTSVEVNGVLGERPRWVGSRLAITAAGKDLSELSALTHLRLPAQRFQIRGRIFRGEDGLAIEGAEVRVGEASVQAAGRIGEPPHLENLDLTVEASGPDLSSFSKLASVGLPEEPFALRGRVVRNGAALDLDEVAGRLGDMDLNVSGRLVLSARLEGSDLQVHVAGPDLAKLASYASSRGVPAESFDVQAHVRVGPDGYELDGVAARAGRLVLTGAGHLGVPPALDGTTVDWHVDGPALSDLEAWGLPAKLPADPFRTSGTLRVRDRDYQVDRVTADVGADRLSVEGTLGPLPDLSRMDVSVAASGPGLDRLGRFLAAAGVEPPSRLPAEPYEVSGRVRRVPGGVDIRALHARIGNLDLRADGTLGSGDALRGTDVRFDARAPDTSLPANVVGHSLPEGPFEAHGRLVCLAAGIVCDGVTVAIGDSRASISGTVGVLPTLFGTDLQVSVSGPNLAALLGPVLDVAFLPPDAFEVSAQLAGSSERLTSSHFAARLGESDLEGSVSIRREDRLVVEADLRARLLDVAALVRGFGEEPEAVPSVPDASAKPPRQKGERVISDQPLPFDVFRTFDATLRLTAENVRVPGDPLSEVVLVGALRDGALQLDRIEGKGSHGGRVTANLTLEPQDDGYRFRTEGRLDGGHLIVSKDETVPDMSPAVDIEFEVQGAGRSLHDFAASSSGAVLVVLGPGRIPNSANDLISSGLMRNLLDALNPLRKSSVYTQLECGIASADIAAGKAAVEPIAARTDKLTILGRGKVDFDTEGIDLVWTIKPRRGIGLSPGSIANPYIKLSGTLAAPRLDLKPIEAAASTGAAVATAGLTVFFRGLYNRVTAEKKVCVNALAKARKQMETRQAAAAR